METRRRSVLLVALVICAVAAVAVVVFFFMTRNRYESTAMVVTWKESTGKPLTVEGFVLRRGSPVANHVLNVETGSGGNLLTTGPDGKFSMNVGELELTALEVEGAGRVDWGLLGGPNLRDGVSVRIELK